MNLQPKRQKHRVIHRRNRTGLSKGGNFVSKGDFGMKAQTRGEITAKQIEACRVSVTRKLRKLNEKNARVFINIFPHIPRTKKPLGVRMGKGKGGNDRFVAKIRPGAILFEVGGASKESAREALALATSKLNIHTTFVERVEDV